MKIRLLAVLFVVFVLNTFFTPDPYPQAPDTAHVAARYKERVDEAYRLFQELKYDPNQKETFIEKLVALRKAVKFTEPIAGFFDNYAINKLFAPNIYKVEYELGEPANEIDPIGFQRIEEMLEEDASADEINLEIRKIAFLFERYRNYAQSLHFSAPAFFLSLKSELIRIQTQGIIGFDTPVYSNCLDESAAALAGMRYFLQPLTDAQPQKSAALAQALDRAIDYLLLHKDEFDDFDRLDFIKAYVNPLYEALLRFQRDLGIENISPDKNNLFAFDQNASNIFNRDFLNPYYFHKSRKAYPSDKIVALGRTLFFDPVLSGNNRRACASCHNPDRAFTESLKTSLNLDGTGYLTRNAPTLVNAAFQHKFQLEGIADNPERQLHLVLFSPEEMGNNQANLVNTLNRSKEYRALFREAFNMDNEINFSMVKYALGGYIRSLIALDSPFDRYMRGETKEISPAVKNGFNLFMGKAACATCHFAPVFNGTVPPMFAETEIEVLGVTRTDDFNHPELDPDPGSWIIGQSEYHKYGFKTPTVRNVEYTAPYMHNGAYRDLETVMEFYNRGGGAGLGLDIPHQTLPFDNLSLTPAEISDIIAFMKSLSDTAGITQRPVRLPDLDDEKLNKRKIGGEY
ncbi:MAG: cytochrome-c peroxidase [Saprospiraceae bacterium]